jgi:hypothetical protein
MKPACLSIAALLSISILHAQFDLNEDSICRFGKKYDFPERKTFTFPASDSSAAYKLHELKKAVPASWYVDPDSVPENYVLTDERNLLSRIYQYYFQSDILDFDEKGDSVYKPKVDAMQYKLKDTYVIDINGDGLPDLLHYPKYYRAFFMDADFYDIFLQQKDGSYKMLHFDGYICDISWNQDNTLNSLKTFSKSFYAENHNAAFLWYTFNKNTNQLVLDKEEEVFKCQLKYPSGKR